MRPASQDALRRRSALLAAALGSVSLGGCAHKPPPPPPVVQMPPAAISASAPVMQRAPSKEIAVRFPYAASEEVTTLVYSDLGPLARPDVAQALVGGLAGWASDTAGVDRACLEAIASGAKELLLGGGQRGWVAIVRVPDHKLETVCVPAARLADETPLEGTTKAWTFKEEARTCATTPGWLACGNNAELVKLALAAGGDGLVPVSLEGDEVLSVDDRDHARDLRVVASSAPDRAVVKVELTFDSDDDARKLHESLERPTELVPAIATESRATPEQQRLVARVARNLVASHRAARASVRVELEESLEQQARDLGDLAGLVSSTLRAKTLRLRTEEARTKLDRMARMLTTAWEAKDSKGPFAARKLVSLPAVPKTVPKGEPVTSPADAWKTWSAIGWALEAPSYYQFEIVAAKDGLSADLVARGDLDGDGKASTYTRHVTVDKVSKKLTIDEVVATDPEE